MRITLVALASSFLLLLGSCTKDEVDPEPNDPVDAGPRLILKFRFDSTQVRLNNLGQPSSVIAGHGAQSPVFNRMSAHYVEFALGALTPLGLGDIVYKAPETILAGDTAIDFDLSIAVGNNEAFLDIPLSELQVGTYQWLRVSLAYQNYNIRFTSSGFPFSGTIASFIGYRTYIGQYLVADSTIAVNANKLQGYWAFEVNDPPLPFPVIEGQSPGTTVVNPLFSTSPVPAGSCVVTGAFPVPLTVTGNETEDVVVIVSVSTNKSFEWIETDGDNVFEPLTPNSETVVDMGIRGMIPTVQ